ncbi:MAG: antitoxin VapB family protein [Thermoplasmatota archaeon]
MHRYTDHAAAAVPSRTISLEQSAYDALAAAKRPGESFSRTVHRLVGTERPRLGDLAGLLGPREAAPIAATLSRLRREDQEGA